MAPLIEVIEEDQPRHYYPRDIMDDVVVVSQSPSDILNAIHLYNKLKSADQRHEIPYLLYRIATFCQQESTRIKAFSQLLLRRF